MAKKNPYDDTSSSDCESSSGSSTDCEFISSSKSKKYATCKYDLSKRKKKIKTCSNSSSSSDRESSSGSKSKKYATCKCDLSKRKKKIKTCSNSGSSCDDKHKNSYDLSKSKKKIKTCSNSGSSCDDKHKNSYDLEKHINKSKINNICDSYNNDLKSKVLFTKVNEIPNKTISSTNTNDHKNKNSTSVNITNIRSPKKYVDIKADNDIESCCVCLTNKKCISYADCFHINSCYSCALSIINGNKKCPTCMTTITKPPLFVYL